MALLFLRDYLRRARRRLRYVLVALTIKPAEGGSPEGDDDTADDKGDNTDNATKDDTGSDAADAKDDDADTDDDADDAADKGTEPDWKKMARKWERDSKRDRKAKDELAAKLKEREDADKSEQEKAIEEARALATTQVTSKFEQERRTDRLEVAVTRLAAKGIKLGDGDDAKTARFADAEDALVHVERGISTGEIDPEEVFDDKGKVNLDALTVALGELLERKPHLIAKSGENGSRAAAGDSDAGKGAAPKKGDLDEMSVEEHLKAVQGSK